MWETKKSGSSKIAVKECMKCQKLMYRTWKYKGRFYCYGCYQGKITKMPNIKRFIKLEAQ